MKRIEFFFGLHDGDGRVLDPKTIDEATQTVQRMLAGTFGGSTVLHGQGSWENSGNLWLEPNLVFVVITNRGHNTIKEVATVIRNVYCQKEVLVSISEVETFSV